MSRKLKLIWDFRGPEADKTAQHHETHLNEFALKEKLELIITDTEWINEMHSIAYLVILEKELKSVRDILKPHRAQIYRGS